MDIDPKNVRGIAAQRAREAKDEGWLKFRYCLIWVGKLFIP